MFYRRLDIWPDKKLRGRERYLRMMRRDLTALGRWFPESGAWTGEYDNFRMPVYQKLLDARHTGQPVRKEALELLVTATKRVADNRPANAPECRVGALISWPALFYSEVCVFFDRTYEQRFLPERYLNNGTAQRQNFEDSWTEGHPVQKNLFEDLGIDIPKGFTAAGWCEKGYDADYGETYTCEHWTMIEDQAA